MIPSPFHGIFSSALDGNALNAGRKGAASQPGPQAPAVKSQGQVALDIFEYDNYYILKAPIAGVKLSDLDIEIADNTITIRGTRKQVDNVPDSQYYLRECFWGEFTRTVTLPCNVDPRKVKATFNKDCILKILVPKEERVKIVRIND